jgi:hypothetical protein
MRAAVIERCVRGCTASVAIATSLRVLFVEMANHPGSTRLAGRKRLRFISSPTVSRIRKGG